ncbi:DUF2000 family protein [Actinomyces provencensis]|uniref:DUF2000 family protein n=1 Tax=Actinomyces provencensis TaxID=1720198 RepID=UPI0018A84D03
METVPQHVVVVVDAGLPRGVLADTVAAISIGLGAASPISGGEPLEDCDHQQVHAVSERGVPVLGAGQSVLGNALRGALPTPGGRGRRALPSVRPEDPHLRGVPGLPDGTSSEG